METIDYDRAAALLDRAVAERGADFVYPNEWRYSDGEVDEDAGICQYFIDGKPACIVGLVFSYVSPHVTETSAEGRGPAMVAEDMGIVLTPSAESLLNAVQTAQDYHWSWGVAVREAKNNVR